jgi:hypothetical protein
MVRPATEALALWLGRDRLEPRRLAGPTEDPEMKQAIEVPINLELTTEDLALVEAGLRLMLMVEDDREEIDRLKALLARVERERASLEA